MQVSTIQCNPSNGDLAAFGVTVFGVVVRDLSYSVEFHSSLLERATEEASGLEAWW